MCPLSGRLNRASGCAAFNSGRDTGPLVMMEMFIYVCHASGLWVRIVTDGRSLWTVGSRAVPHDVMSLPDPWIRKHAFRLLGQNRSKCADGWLGGVVSYLRRLDSSISQSGHLGGAPSAGTRLPLPVKMKFLMQPIGRSTVLEEVNDSDIPMEPLHYPVTARSVRRRRRRMLKGKVHRRHPGSRLAR